MHVPMAASVSLTGKLWRSIISTRTDVLVALAQDPVAELFTLQGGAPTAFVPASNAAGSADPFGFAEFSDSNAPPAAAAPPVRMLATL